MTQGVADQFGGDVDNLDHAVVRHAGGANYAQRAHYLSVHFIRRAHDRQLFKRHHLALAADEDAHAFGLSGDVFRKDVEGKVSIPFLGELPKAPADEFVLKPESRSSARSEAHV